MRKFYLLLSAFFVLTYANAQKRGNNFSPRVYKLKTRPGFPQNFIQGACDTLNLAASNAWGIANYVYDQAEPIDTGFFCGTNAYGDLAKAEYFDASSTTDNYVSKVYILFAVAYSTDTTKTVPVDVYDGTSGAPGALLGTTSTTIGSIENDVNNFVFTEIDFSPAIKLPASRQFFVSINLSNLSWSTKKSPVSDTLAVFSSDQDSTTATGAWELDQPGTSSDWISFLNQYGGDLGLYIFPLIGADQTCSSLPVHLLSFTAQAKDKDVLLNWNVAQEINMKQYVVERADGNLNFSAVGTVAASNSQLNHAYSFTDPNALTLTGNKLYYRLKQVNSDGSFMYSNIINLAASGALSIKVVNPFKNTVQLQISSPYNQKLQAAIYDLQGRKVTAVSEQNLVAGQNLITLPINNTLAKGVYILNVYTGNTVYKYKILNQ